MKAIKYKGLILNPTSIMDIDFYPDADLFGTFVHENPMGTS